MESYPPRWSECIEGQPRPQPATDRPRRLGVLEGEGIGPEVVRATLHVLAALESVSALRFETRFGGPIGLAAERKHGTPLTEEVVQFCADVFAAGGAVLAGAGGGRFVYDLRKRFDLFCKISPLTSYPELSQACRLKAECIRNVDCLLIRENVAGIYQGRWREEVVPGQGRRAHHEFAYTESEVRRVVDAAARIAQRRSGRLAVVLKDAGIPSISALWRDCATDAAARLGVNLTTMNVDYAAYRLVQHPQEFDVIVTSNLFGDLLADLGSVLLGSRALSYAGNFAAGVPAVYQTNHGAASDLAGTNRANPLGQIFSLAMLLHESFGLVRAADLIKRAVQTVWRAGWLTDDLAQPDGRLAGTREMGELVADAVIHLAKETAVD